MQEVLARKWALHAIISAKRHLEENAAQAGIQQQMQEKKLQLKEKDNAAVDEILASVNQPQGTQGTLSQMLEAHAAKREEREHASKADTTKRGVESATHRTPQKETAKRRKNPRLCTHGEECIQRNCAFEHPDGQKILSRYRDSKKREPQRGPRGEGTRGRSHDSSAVCMGTKRRRSKASVADSEQHGKETQLTITARLQITCTAGERKITNRKSGRGTVKFSLGPSTQTEITNANKKGHFLENKDTEILRKRVCRAANSPTYTHTSINNHSHTHTHTIDITHTSDGRDLFTDQSARLQRVLHRIMKMPVTKLLNRSKTLSIKYFLDSTADSDPILKSTAAKRLFSRGSNFAMTPSTNSITRILEDLDRLEFRILGSVMRKMLETGPPSKLKKIESALNLQHFKNPAPVSISLLRKNLTLRKDWARQRGLGELNCRIRETCMTILDTILQTRTRMAGQLRRTQRRECNISKEEQDVLKHIQALGNIRMNKLDKNLGIVVYSVSCETEAIKGHLESKNFTKLQACEGQNMIETRQKLWDQTLQHAADLFAEIELPEEMSKMLLQLIPHLQIRLSHMYVVWKIIAGATRPIVPSFTAPTALASKWIHEHFLPYVITIPTICMDSLAYTRELDNLILPVPWTGLIVCLDVVALYPSIPTSARERQRCICSYFWQGLVYA